MSNHLLLLREHYFQRNSSKPWDFVTQPLLPSLVLILCQFLWPVITSVAPYLTSWTPVDPSCPLLEDACQLDGFLCHVTAWWKLSVAPIFSTSNLNHSFLGFGSLPRSGPTPPVSSPYFPTHTISHLYCQALVMLSGYVLVEMSSLTLAFSKHIHLLPMKSFLVLLNLIFGSSEFIGVCDMYSAVLYSLFSFIWDLYVPLTTSKRICGIT